jgi:hypothetical protein
MSSPRRPSSGNSKRGDRSELITHSGLRFVGSAAALVSDQYGVTLDATLRPEDVLYAAQLEVRPRSASGDAVGVLLAVLGDALGRAGHGDAHIGRGGPVAESSDRFRGFHWDTFASGDSWTGELTWIHPHPALGGVPLTTHVLLVERGARVSATIHVGARGGTAGVYGLVAAGQARPAFLAEMKRLTRLTFEGASPEPHILDDLEVFGFVRDRLLSKTRRQPIAVLAPLEPKDPLDPV